MAQDGRSRNWDGSPESEFDTRFHDLRDSGYRGPIDQDGYARTEPEVLAIFEDMDRRRAARMADEDGMEDEA